MALIRARPDAARAGFPAPDPALPDLQAALDSARPGDTVRLEPGVFRHPVVVRRGGARDLPIVVRGAEGALIDGGQHPGPAFAPGLLALADRGVPPDRRSAIAGALWRFFTLRGTSWVEFEELAIQGCWPLVFYAEDCRHVALRRSRIVGATRVFFAWDDARHEASGHIAIEGNSWTQDPSPGHELWRRIRWADAHDRDGPYGYFNGALFAGLDIAGPVAFRANLVSDAFNAIRCTVSPELRDRVLAAPAHALRRNRDVLVAENRFVRVRDNPIEPERYALNWTVCRNEFHNCYTWFSCDGVGGGFWQIYANRGWFDEMPGGGDHNLGKLLKFDGGGPYPDAPFAFFNNSCFIRHPIAHEGDNPIRTRNLAFFDNAIEFCTGGALCPAGLRAFGRLEWDAANRFDGNLTNEPSYFAALRPLGQEANGVLASAPLFVDAARGNLALRRGRPGRRRGVGGVLTLADGSLWTMPAGRDIGAYHDGRPVEGPPFVRT